MARSGPGVLWRAREIVDRSARQSPARLALGVFAAVIALVTVLLSAPWATAHGGRAPFVDALFTATSASTACARPPSRSIWPTTASTEARSRLPLTVTA